MKHHLRGFIFFIIPITLTRFSIGERGIYYDDLYHLVRPMHDVSAYTCPPQHPAIDNTFTAS